jgi:hypothetical protein
MGTDLFDDLLGLEQQFYDEGFQLGQADGAEAGRIEGRVFGLEKGFEKYTENGRLHGKSLVWASRLPKSHGPNRGLQDTIIPTNAISPATSLDAESSTVSLPVLQGNPRLEKHIRVLYALTEPASLSTENTEDAANDLDDRLRRAKAKAKIIERLIGENKLSRGDGHGTTSGSSRRHSPSGELDGNIEDTSVLKARQ